MNIGFQEIILVLLVALIFLGPKKMKGLARTLGKVVREFQRVRDRIVDEIEEETTPPDEEDQDPGP